MPAKSEAKKMHKWRTGRPLRGGHCEMGVHFQLSTTRCRGFRLLRMQPGSYNSVPFRLVVGAVSCSEVHLCFALKLAKPPRIPPSNEYNAEMDALECVYSASKNPNDIEVEYD